MWKNKHFCHINIKDARLCACSKGTFMVDSRYLLMNRSHAAAEFTLNTDENGILDFHAYNPKYLPFRIKYADDRMQTIALWQWIQNRIMPSERYGRHRLFSVIGSNRLQNSLKAYCSSLTDGYWIKNIKDKITWTEASYFTGQFSYDIGGFIFGRYCNHPDMHSPDLTTNGRLQKTWVHDNGTIYLIKTGSAPFFNEPYVEEIASKIIQRISAFPVVEYKKQEISGRTCSICEGFVQESCDLVTADELYHLETKPAYCTPDLHLRNMCKKLQIPEYKQFLDNLLYIDYVVGNADRNLGNFGFLFNSETGKFIGPAPIYDNGAAFGFNEQPMLTLDQYVFSDISDKVFERIHHPESICKPDVEILSNTVRSGCDSLHFLSEDQAKQLADKISSRAKTFYEKEQSLQQKREHRKEYTL